ncbi:resolvase [Hymenobacter qilianensis]|uniref:Recombinase family protein n=2 Tax=Hymenobacter qilianensis TaxID=1385715 RepID=A0A7H0H134_9BACT|nr:recombinase family protein [Hymenobacter qilianensis]QNP54250.1 recombinase family protein [Hymenobacter qilianensis]GGF79714.1 resolvase [Hymenobacter qilianensis]
MRKYVAYYRVSTARQGASGLGLEAQQAAVQTFAKHGLIVQAFTEVESGKQNQRVQLLEAIAVAKAAQATLLIAKLDRLSRNAGFIFALRDSGVDFTCCDMPDANSLTVGLFAILAQHERETISTRTRDALRAKRARGYTLGTPANLTEAARARSIQVRQQKRQQAPTLRQALSLITLLHAQGVAYAAIARRLNAAGFTTLQGKPYSHVQVKRMLDYAHADQARARGTSTPPA